MAPLDNHLVRYTEDAGGRWQDPSQHIDGLVLEA